VKTQKMLFVMILGCMLLIFSACGGGAAAPKATTAAPLAQTATKPQPTAPQAAGATPAPQANQANSGVDCTALVKANTSFGSALAKMVNLTADTDYSAFTDASSPFYLDFSEIRGDLDTLSTLPDPTSTEEQIFGKPSTSIAYFRQMVDVAEKDVQAAGKPFTDKDANGVQVLGMGTPWMQNDSSFALAMEQVCAGFTLPADTPAADAAAVALGDTSTLGDLRVTLDKVAQEPGTVNNVPDAGDRFLIVYVTIENTGKTPVSLLSFSQASMADAAGKLYGYNLKTVMVTSALQGITLSGEIQPGEKGTAAGGYEVPTDAGDLTWTMNDFAQHHAAFAIPANSIVMEGTPITAGEQNDADATATAFYGMINSISATEDATTPEPEATETPAP
jgi:hypothetical protein